VRGEEGKKGGAEGEKDTKRRGGDERRGENKRRKGG
jgi:hypothetical protein